MAELSEEPMSDHSDESLGILYYSNSTSGATLSLTSVMEGGPATMIPRNKDNVERIKEWIAWVDGTGNFPLAADEPKNPSPPACLEGLVLESTWWESADLYFPLCGTGEVDHSQSVTRVLQRSAISPIHKITVIIASETNINGVGIHEIPLEKLFRLCFDLHCRCDLFEMKVVMKVRAVCKNPVDGERTLCKPAHPRLSEPLLLLLDYVFEDLKEKEFRDIRNIKDTLDFYGLGFPPYWGPPKSERRQDGQKILDAPEGKRQEITHQVLARYAAEYVRRECLYRKSPAMSHNWIESLFKHSFPSVDIENTRSREKHYGQHEVDMSEWILMLEGHVHDGPPEEIVHRIDMRFWTQEQKDEYNLIEALENGWIVEDLTHWRANLRVIGGHQADVDDEMGDDTDPDDEDDEDEATATNYSLTPRVLKALQKSLPPHLLEALKNGPKNAAENAQVARDT
ncbi:hypothetical protein KCU77_g2612, partial [Aureobasidium melanogenum]